MRRLTALLLVGTAVCVVFSSAPLHGATLISDGFSGTELDTALWKVAVPGIAYDVSGGHWNVTDVSTSAPGPSGWHLGTARAHLVAHAGDDFHVQVWFEWEKINYQWFQLRTLRPDSSTHVLMAVMADPRHYLMGYNMGDDIGSQLYDIDSLVIPVEQTFRIERTHDTVSLVWNGLLLGRAVNAAAMETIELRFARWSSSEFGTVRIDSIDARRSTGTADILRVPQDYPTIQAGINAAVDGDTVLVAPGTYNESLSFGGRNIVLMSSDDPQVTFLDGTGLTTRILTFGSSETRNAVCRGFTIQYAYYGAMSCWGSSPTLTENIFQYNLQMGKVPRFWCRAEGIPELRETSSSATRRKTRRMAEQSQLTMPAAICEGTCSGRTLRAATAGRCTRGTLEFRRDSMSLVGT